VWVLTAARSERDEIDGRCAAGAVVPVNNGMFGVSLQQAPHIVILSMLPAHHDLDHRRFTTLGAMLGTGDRLLAGCA
jgi:hypothetical protein